MECDSLSGGSPQRFIPYLRMLWFPILTGFSEPNMMDNIDKIEVVVSVSLREEAKIEFDL